MFDAMLEKFQSTAGVIAALDQSGGSTPKALANYGVSESAYNGEDAMFAKVHEMRSRIIQSPAFDSRVLGAILFENTMDRSIQGMPTAQYLWQQKNVVPFLKVDSGLDVEKDGVQMMKPMPHLAALLDKARAAGIFGTKMRSLIRCEDGANAGAINRVVAQQFAVGREILAKGLVPIIEPEVAIDSPHKAECEQILKAEILTELAQLQSEGAAQVLLKLSLPSTADFYQELVEHPQVLRVVALSGGYSREQACALCSQNHGVMASFSRALTEGLSAQQTQEEFDQQLDAAIEAIYRASLS